MILLARTARNARTQVSLAGKPFELLRLVQCQFSFLVVLRGNQMLLVVLQPPSLHGRVTDPLARWHHHDDHPTRSHHDSDDSL